MNLLRLVVLLALLALAAPAASVAAPPAVPAATATDATNITFQSATLNGLVDAHGAETTYHFEYGTTTAYGTSTPNGTVPGSHSSSSGTVNADIGSLVPSTVYHFKLVATNSVGTTESADKTFTTPASPYAPPPVPNTVSISVAPVTITFGSTSVVSGQVAGSNNAGVQVQLQENPYPYTGGFKNVGATIPTDATGKYAFTVKPGLHTRYQVVAKASPPVTSAVVQVLVRFRVGFSVSDTKVHRGQRVRFKGTVAPAHDGRRIRIQRRTSTGSYKTIKTVTLTKSSIAGRSNYSTRIRVYRKGVYRARIGSDADHLTGTSRTRTIRIG